jgi:hypothetical protein
MRVQRVLVFFPLRSGHPTWPSPSRQLPQFFDMLLESSSRAVNSRTMPGCSPYATSAIAFRIIRAFADNFDERPSTLRRVSTIACFDILNRSGKCKSCRPLRSDTTFSSCPAQTRPGQVALHVALPGSCMGGRLLSAREWVRARTEGSHGGAPACLRRPTPRHPAGVGHKPRQREEARQGPRGRTGGRNRHAGAGPLGGTIACPLAARSSARS